MKKNMFTINLAVLFALAISACAAPMATESPIVNSSDLAPADEPAPNQAVSEQAAQDQAQTITEVDLPDWFTQELKDVSSGASFKVNDFNGKVILVETLAVWCPKCLSQQQEVARLKTLLAGRDDFVSIGIDIDPNENEALLADHVKRYGFDWLFAIAPKTLIDEISMLYGAQFLNPPATPILIIDKQGKQHPLAFGIKSAEDLQAALQPFLNAE